MNCLFILIPYMHLWGVWWVFFVWFFVIPLFIPLAFTGSVQNSSRTKKKTNKPHTQFPALIHPLNKNQCVNSMPLRGMQFLPLRQLSGYYTFYLCKQDAVLELHKQLWETCIWTLSWNSVNFILVFSLGLFIFQLILFFSQFQRVLDCFFTYTAPKPQAFRQLLISIEVDRTKLDWLKKPPNKTKKNPRGSFMSKLFNKNVS